MKNEAALSRNEILSELTKSPHGDLTAYVPTGKRAATEQPEYLARLIAWNREHGEIRDSKVALPVVTLATDGFPDAFVENSYAHLLALDPRNLYRALRFAKTIGTPGRKLRLEKLVTRYLRVREENTGWFDRTALQHRESLRALYSYLRIKPSDRAQIILHRGTKGGGKNGGGKVRVGYPTGSVFEAVANLKTMTPSQAAGAIIGMKIPHLVALGALGDRVKDPAICLALIEGMTPAELVNNSKLLEKLGIKTNPALRGAYAAALGRAGANKKGAATLKAGKAAAAVDDDVLREKLLNLQETQIARVKETKGLEGDWLVLGDKSGSMSTAIEWARQLAAHVAKFTKGDTHLFFFDSEPRYVEATGKTLEDIKSLTKHVQAGGGTSIGCGLRAAMDRRLNIDGIVLVSDGAEHHPPYFYAEYEAMVKKTDKVVPIYFCRVPGEHDTLSSQLKGRGINVQVIDVDGGDYYSIPNIISTLRANVYSLFDEIMETPLLTINDVLKVA
jgi:hypothetical protein